MRFGEVFQSKAKQLSWERLKDDARGAAIEKNKAYFVIRLKEMYVAISRKLWRKYYPMLHSYVEHGVSQENAIAGPGQLRELGESHLDRIVNLNHRLAGPTPYTGEDVSMLVGLYSVPGQDAAKALIETVSTFAALGGVAASPSIEIANAVKSGVDKIIGLNDSKLQLGIRDTFNAGQPLTAGVHVGMSAAIGTVDFSKLQLRGGRLHIGDDPISAKPYQAHDYMVIEVERWDTRDDWPGLPGISEFEERFGAIMADMGLAVSDKRKRLEELWPAFQQALASSKLLTTPDRENIADSVSQDLNTRLDKIGGEKLFETKNWGGEVTGSAPPEQFDFLDIPQYTNRKDPESLRRAAHALTGQPFRS